MAHQSNDPSPKDIDLAKQQEDAPIHERVQELTWAVIDDVATDDDMRLLDNLLLSDDEAVSDYVGCVQMHVDLMAHFSAGSTDGSALSQLPFSFPIDGMPPLGIEPQQS